MAAKKKNGAIKDSFKILEGLKGVRAKSTMYLGELGDPMVFRMLKEIADNCYDEHKAGRNSHIEVVVNPKTNVYLVADRAGGIPTEMQKLEDGSKVSIMTAVFTKLHAGGKFDDKAYKVSSGTHGVGSAAVNACSSHLEVWSNYKGKCHYQEFREGKPVKANPQVIKTIPKEVIEQLQMPKAKTYGTVVRFTPDQTVISEDARYGDSSAKAKKYKVARLSLKNTLPWLRNLAMLNPGLTTTMTLAHKGHKTKTFINKKGLGWLVRNTAQENELTMVGRKPVEFQDDFLSFAVQWTSLPTDDLFLSFVNSSPTIEHGLHVKGFTDALARAIKPHAKKNDKYTQSDLLLGACAVVNWNMHGAQYSSQVKDKLVSNVNKEIEKLVFPVLVQYFKENANVARTMIKRAGIANKGRADLAKTMKAMTETRKKGKGAIIPDVLTMATKAKPHERELFIVEGDSAGGCFVGSTLVLLSDGTSMHFDEMAERTKQGEVFKGKSFDIEKQEFVEIEFDEPRLTKYADELIEVELSDGTKHLCTPDHPWLVGTEYCAAEDLKEGDELVQLPIPSSCTEDS